MAKTKRDSRVESLEEVEKKDPDWKEDVKAEEEKMDDNGNGDDEKYEEELVGLEVKVVESLKEKEKQKGKEKKKRRRVWKKRRGAIPGRGQRTLMKWK